MTKAKKSDSIEQTPETETLTQTEGVSEVMSEQTVTEGVENVAEAFDPESLNPMERGIYAGFRETVSTYIGLKDKVAKKSENDFDAEAKEMLVDSERYQAIAKQIADLEETRKNIYQDVRNGIKEEYESRNVIDPEVEQAYQNAKEMYTTGRNYLKLSFPVVFNAIAKEFNLTQRESSPRVKKDSAGSENGDSGRRIRGFTFEVSGINFKNATSTAQHLGLTSPDFQKLFFEAQGTDNTKEWRSIVFEAAGKSIEANKLAK